MPTPHARQPIFLSGLVRDLAPCSILRSSGETSAQMPPRPMPHPPVKAKATSGACRSQHPCHPPLPLLPWLHLLVFPLPNLSATSASSCPFKRLGTLEHSTSGPFYWTLSAWLALSCHLCGKALQWPCCWKLSPSITPCASFLLYFYPQHSPLSNTQCSLLIYIVSFLSLPPPERKYLRGRDFGLFWPPRYPRALRMPPVTQQEFRTNRTWRISKILNIKSLTHSPPPTV